MYPTHIFASTDSTNRIALDMAKKGAPHGTGILAEMQVKGRGRLDRSWYSPAKKGLYCSVIVRPQLSVEDYPKITLVAGLSVAQTLIRTCACQCSVKWPNDIYCSGRKLGGILTESSSFPQGSDESFAVVGIGVNIRNSQEDFEPELTTKATSVFLETNKIYKIEAVFQAIRLELLRGIEIFEQKGFEEVLGRWKELDMLQGKMVRWMQPNGEYLYGKSRGPDCDGRLIIQETSGEYHQVLYGDVLLKDR